MHMSMHMHMCMHMCMCMLCACYMHVCLAAVGAIVLVCQHHRHRLITPATALGLQPASEGVAATPRAVAVPIEGPQLQVAWEDN